MTSKYSLFNEVENTNLKTWNRCATMYNILRDESMEEMTKYIGNFNEAERNDISMMFERVRKEGYEKVKASINREINDAAATS